MAKVTGPLMSMDASGKFAGALVFSKWKGRPTVRQLVTPSNPRSSDQVAIRNNLRVTAAAQRWANLTSLVLSGETDTDKVRLTAAAPAGQAWNGFLVKSILGAGGLDFDTAEGLYAALTGPQQAAWDAAAGALSPAIPAVAQFDTNNSPSTPIPAGEVFFIYMHGLYMAGLLAAVPNGTPPTYA